MTREFATVCRGSCPLVMETISAPGLIQPGSITGERELVARLTIGWFSTALLAESTASTSMFRKSLIDLANDSRCSLVELKTFTFPIPGSARAMATIWPRAWRPLPIRPRVSVPLGARYLPATPAGAPVRQTFNPRPATRASKSPLSPSNRTMK